MDTMTLTTGGTGTAPRPVGAADSRPQTTPPAARAGRPGRIRRLWRGADADPSWARPALLGLLLVTLVLYTWNLTASGYANSFYSAAVQAGSDELEGVLLRQLRRRQLDHRRQAAGLPLGDGPVGAAARPQLVRDPAAAGAHGRRDRRRRLHHGQAPVRCCGGPHRRRRPRADPRRRPDVHLQQPRRPPDPAHGARRLGHDQGDRAGLAEVDDDRRGLHRPRLPHQDPPGPARRAVLRARLPHRRPDDPAQAHRPLAPRRRHHGAVGRLVGRDRRARPGLGPPVHRWQPDELLPRADLRLQRPRPPQR